MRGAMGLGSLKSCLIPVWVTTFIRGGRVAIRARTTNLKHIAMMTATTVTAQSAAPDWRPRARNGALRNVPCRALSMRPEVDDAYAAFEREGMSIAVYEVECIFLVNVLTDCGNMYTYDGSHGCGQVFTHCGSV